MNQKFKITIPKPCNKNWNKMTPKEKGRFCSSCAKTVVDFTKKSTIEIKEYLVENKEQKVCGHFYKKQLDTITIQIPQTTFNQQMSFQKVFILALFFVMGTTLFSCKYSDGKKQKIENVVIVDTLKKVEEKIDSLTLSRTKKGKLMYSTYCPPQKKDLVNEHQFDEVIILGAIEGEVSLEEETDEISFLIIQNPPRFKEARNLSKVEAKKDFDIIMKKLFHNNIIKKSSQNLGLISGRKRILFQIIINEKGNVVDIRVRAPHPKLKEHVTNMLKKLPQFIYGKQAGNAVKTKYNFPITFMVE